MKLSLNPPRPKDKLKVIIENRHSCRDFESKTLSLDDITTILWATCGKKQDSTTGATRTIPSAGATYPLELYIVVGKNCIDRLKEGVYHYLIGEHSLELIKEGDIRAELAQACLGQNFIKQAPASLVIVAIFGRTTNRYGKRGERYVYIEAGHASQNAYLMSTNLGLNTVEVGAFDDDYLKRALGLNQHSTPIIVLPIGYGKTWDK